MHPTLLSSSTDQRLASPDEWQPAASGPAHAASIIQAPCAAPPAAEPAAARQRNPMHGFTLIELMIAVTVAGVLSSVALPSFEGVLLRARRSDVLVSMMSVQLAQERFRSNSASYGSLGEIGMPGLSAARHYTLQVTAASADTYEVFAAATGAQARDTACRHMKLRAVGGNTVHASGPDTSVANPDAANRKCWSL